MKTLRFLAWGSVGLALTVVVLGAWVRLSHAGLGCPDWPGCYGEITWPDTSEEINIANEAYPERPVSIPKAWKEMLHRYVAGSLMLLVYGITFLTYRRRRELPGAFPLAMGIAALITLQAAFGMWTVTLKLLPLVVTAHLLGGMATFSLLVWQALRMKPQPSTNANPVARTVSLRGPLIAGLVLLVGQIALGGWTSSNYAALACTEIPTCNGEWWPDPDFGEGFTLAREIGVDYEGGVLDYPARVAIHTAHRIGAVIVTAWMLLLCFLLATRGRVSAGLVLGSALLLQVALGVANVLGSLPLPVAVAHNGGAALLLAVLVVLLRPPIMRR
ncbi:MAG: COX15/CtaA family protein [Pseudomonadota bacterium]